MHFVNGQKKKKNNYYNKQFLKKKIFLVFLNIYLIINLILEWQNNYIYKIKGKK